MVKRFVVAASLTLALAACQDDGFNRSSRHLSPIPPATLSLMAQKGMSKADPIVIRSYKKEAEMEVWKKGSDGRYALLKTYPICRWSGQLGPKVREGDRQAPEGFYSITPAQMNPNSSYFLSFDTGYPNAYDRAHGRSGSHLMVHGSCSSRGCFAMTDESIAELYALGREAFGGGQRTFQFQSYPFRMTAKNLAQHRYDPHMPFWKNLKEGSDYFEATREEPKVGVCGKQYVFGGADVAQGNCSPELEPAVAQKRQQDEQEVAELVAKGVEPIRLVYDDGGTHQSFKQALADATAGDSMVVDARAQARLGLISRPDSVASGPQEIILEANGKPKQDSAPATALAFASQKPAAPAVSAAPATPVAAAPSSPAPAKPVQVAAAPAPATPAPAQPVAASAAETPFYKKMLGGIGDLFSTSSASPAQPAATEPAVISAPAKTPKSQASVKGSTNVATAN